MATLQEKINIEIDIKLNALSDNDPKAFEDAIKIKAEIRTMIKCLTL